MADEGDDAMLPMSSGVPLAPSSARAALMPPDVVAASWSIKLSLSLANTFGEGSDDDNDKEDRQQEASRGAVFAVGRGKAVGILICGAEGGEVRLLSERCRGDGAFDSEVTALAWVGQDIVAAGYACGHIATYRVDGQGGELYRACHHKARIASLRLSPTHVVADSTFDVWIVHSDSVVVAMPLAVLLGERDGAPLAWRLRGQKTTAQTGVVVAPRRNAPLFEAETPPGAAVLFTAGANPAMAFAALSRTAVGDVTLRDLATAVAGKVAAFWGWGSSSSDAKDGDAPQELEAKPLSVTRALNDATRIVSSALPDPVDGRFVVTVDNFGRVCLVDIQSFRIVRMWKGVREAGVGWITRPEGLFLVLHAPRRDTLELWRVPAGPRAAATRAPHLRGCNIITAQEQGRARCYAFRCDGNGKSCFAVEISVPSSARLAVLDWRAVEGNRRDADVVERLTAILRADVPSREDILGIFSEIQDPRFFRRALESIAEADQRRRLAPDVHRSIHAAAAAAAADTKLPPDLKDILMRRKEILVAYDCAVEALTDDDTSALTFTAFASAYSAAWCADERDAASRRRSASMARFFFGNYSRGPFAARNQERAFASLALGVDEEWALFVEWALGASDEEIAAADESVRRHFGTVPDDVAYARQRCLDATNLTGAILIADVGHFDDMHDRLKILQRIRTLVDALPPLSLNDAKAWPLARIVAHAQLEGGISDAAAARRELALVSRAAKRDEADSVDGGGVAVLVQLFREFPDLATSHAASAIMVERIVFSLERNEGLERVVEHLARIDQGTVCLSAALHVWKAAAQPQVRAIARAGEGDSRIVRSAIEVLQIARAHIASRTADGEVSKGSNEEPSSWPPLIGSVVSGIVSPPGQDAPLEGAIELQLAVLSALRAILASKSPVRLASLFPTGTRLLSSEALSDNTPREASPAIEKRRKKFLRGFIWDAPKTAIIALDVARHFSIPQSWVDGERLLALYAIGDDLAAEEVYTRANVSELGEDMENIARIRFALLVKELRSSSVHASLLALVSPETLRWSSKADGSKFPIHPKRTPLSSTLQFMQRIQAPSESLKKMAGAAQTILNRVKK